MHSLKNPLMYTNYLAHTWEFFTKIMHHSKLKTICSFMLMYSPTIFWFSLFAIICHSSGGNLRFSHASVKTLSFVFGVLEFQDSISKHSISCIRESFSRSANFSIAFTLNIASSLFSFLFLCLSGKEY
jgi:hypothetical protein